MKELRKMLGDATKNITSLQKKINAIVCIINKIFEILHVHVHVYRKLKQIRRELIDIAY